MPDILALLSDPQTYISLFSLTLLEIVLGIDNIIFISILAARLPEAQRDQARVIGLLAALLGRLLLLGSITWLTQLTKPWVTLWSFSLSGKDLILLVGGLFLIWKSAQEIYDKVEGDAGQHGLASSQTAVTLKSVVLQIILIDVVFSIDSIITAVGLVSDISIMVAAILISLTVMIVSSKHIAAFVDKHPSIKILALSFLLMIGTLLTAEAFHTHVPKGYVYASLLFALFVEMINIRAQARKKT